MAAADGFDRVPLIDIEPLRHGDHRLAKVSKVVPDLEREVL